MIITFVSECEGKAADRSKRILDLFAERIGRRTWQTRCTLIGLESIYLQLRVSASKNTAVACHRVTTRKQVKLLWIVGNKNKFHTNGKVPISSTSNSIRKKNIEDDWQYLELIKCISALAALFHDWGKASKVFIKKLEKQSKVSDPFRHEWVSLVLFASLIKSSNSNESSDLNWLNLIANSNFSNEIFSFKKLQEIDEPFSVIKSNLSRSIGWLILSHHRMPFGKNKNENKAFKLTGEIFKFESIFKGELLKNTYKANSEKVNSDNCFKFPKGLPYLSEQWRKLAKRYANKTIELLKILPNDEDLFRVCNVLSRTCLMAGDHIFSGKQKERIWENYSNYSVFANTIRSKNKVFIPNDPYPKYKQCLDEHLIGVTKTTIHTAQKLSLIEEKLPKVENKTQLNKLSPPKYNWQNKAVNKIKSHVKKSNNSKKNGWFIINMASTGCGKTFANARIMNAISKENGLRYVLGLGLRSLAQQTGTEYQKMLNLSEAELAVLIGTPTIIENNQNEVEKTGSESADLELFPCEISVIFQDYEEYDFLDGLFKNNKAKKLLYAPIVCCTIDYMMPATEGINSGNHIIPLLRLLSSDLVIDEIDDFEANDLIAISRLVHTAGMLGRKVMISSATISPAIAESMFAAYSTGWSIYNKFKSGNYVSPEINIATIDEFKTSTSLITSNNLYNEHHSKFVKNRCLNLREIKIKRKGFIVEIDVDKSERLDSSENKKNLYYKTMTKHVFAMHDNNHVNDPITKKNISFGLIRLANIKPCVQMAQYLCNISLPSDYDIKVLCYHSRNTTILRHKIETHLSIVLNRKNKKHWQNNAIIRKHINNSTTKNILFLVVSTPVEEVGRDHDFDWAIIEPSSCRSIIQLAGRVLRHRDVDVSQTNIAIMNSNIKGFLGNKLSFTKPGFESKEFALQSHQVREILDEKFINNINSIPRIRKPNSLNTSELSYQKSLIDLEHFSLEKTLNYKKESNYGASTIKGWLEEPWYMTGHAQLFTRFRDGKKPESIFYFPKQSIFQQFDYKVKKFIPVNKIFNISSIKVELNGRQWLDLSNFDELYKQIDSENISEKQALLRYALIRFIDYESSSDSSIIERCYNDFFGLFSK